MRRDERGRLFRACRFILRRVRPRYRGPSGGPASSPTVYVVHHRNLKGPLACLTWMRESLRPWVFSLFCVQRTCYRQYRDFTYTVRYGLPRPLASVLAWPVSHFISRLMRSMRAIPVHRGSRRIVETFQQSVEALVQGEHLLVCPDVDNTDEGAALGEIYDGFLGLDRLFHRKTARHLSFVPLYVDDANRSIRAGEAVRFDGPDARREERPAVLRRLRDEFLRLEGAEPPSGT